MTLRRPSGNRMPGEVTVVVRMSSGDGVDWWSGGQTVHQYLNIRGGQGVVGRHKEVGHVLHS